MYGAAEPNVRGALSSFIDDDDDDDDNETKIKKGKLNYDIHKFR